MEVRRKEGLMVDNSAGSPRCRRDVMSRLQPSPLLSASFGSPLPFIPFAGSKLSHFDLTHDKPIHLKEPGVFSLLRIGTTSRCAREGLAFLIIPLSLEPWARKC